jgi:hypothetical protein
MYYLIGSYVTAATLGIMYLELSIREYSVSPPETFFAVTDVKARVHRCGFHRHLFMRFSQAFISHF